MGPFTGKVSRVGPVRQAMILAAGRGDRLRPLTDFLPKPLVSVGGRPLIVHHLNGLAAAGIERVVINIGHLGEQLPARLGHRWSGMVLEYSDERSARLETGGAIVRAMEYLGEDPFILVNGDVCTDFPWRRLVELPSGDAALVLVPNPPHHPRGDFAVEDGLVAPPVQDGHTYTYAGIARFPGAWFRSFPPVPAKLAPWLRQWIEERRLAALPYFGRWFDVGTLERLVHARAVCGAGNAV